VGIGHGSIIGENTVLQRKVGLSAQIGKNSYLSMWVKVFYPDMAKIGNNVVINPGLYVARHVADNEVVKLTRDSIRTYQFMADPDINISTTK
jgi:UDP-3-O-[3-hydroxymyristoyl] glucosamine N-acyltransferase